MKNNSRIFAYSNSFLIAAGIGTAFSLLGYQDQGTMPLFPAVFLIYGPFSLLLGRLFMRKERSLLGVIVFQLILLIPAILTLLLGFRVEPGMLVLAIIALAAQCFKTFQALEADASRRSLVVTLDGSLLWFVFALWIGGILKLSPLFLLPLALGCIFQLFLLAEARKAAGSFSFGRSFGLLTVSAAAAGAFLALAAEAAGKGLVNLWEMGYRFVTAILRLIGRFLAWLISLLPEADMTAEPETLEAPVSSGAAALEEAELSPVGEMILRALLILMILLCLYFLLRSLSRIRVGGQKKKRPAGTVIRKKRVSLLEALKRLAEEGRERRLERQFLKRHKDSPRELYYSLVRALRVSAFRKRKWETPRGFLLRLAASAREPQLCRAFLELADAADRELFGRQTQSVTPENRSLLRSLIREPLGKLAKPEDLCYTDISEENAKENRMEKDRHCPVCGQYEFEELGAYEICPICGWEDDPLQRREREYAGGANVMSLSEARADFAKRSAALEQSFAVKPELDGGEEWLIEEEEPKEAEWNPDETKEDI